MDGRAVPVLRADYLLRAVVVPAGRHRVEFRYESPAVRRGLLVSLGSLAVILVMFGMAWWSARRRGVLAPAAA